MNAAKRPRHWAAELWAARADRAAVLALWAEAPAEWRPLIRTYLEIRVAWRTHRRAR